MYTLSFITEVKDGIYNLQLPLSMKEGIIEQYNLNKLGKIKEYWINNVKISSDRSRIIFNYINDKSNIYKEEQCILIQEYDIKECPCFSFYKTDIEDIYLLYETIINNVKIQLREYQEYLTLDYICEDLSNFEDINNINI